MRRENFLESVDDSRDRPAPIPWQMKRESSLLGWRRRAIAFARRAGGCVFAPCPYSLIGSTDDQRRVAPRWRVRSRTPGGSLAPSSARRWMGFGYFSMAFVGWAPALLVEATNRLALPIAYSVARGARNVSGQRDWR